MHLSFIAFLLSVGLPALQGNNGWKVHYASSDVCALRGSTVEITCNYKYPFGKINFLTTVKTLWFTKGENDQPVDLKDDADYTGRVETRCVEETCTLWSCEGKCTLRVREMRQSDSAKYKFRIMTSNEKGHTGQPGVIVTVTDLQVKVSAPSPADPTSTVLTCLSMCGVAGDPHYIWLRNGGHIHQGKTYSVKNMSEGNYACAVKKYKHLQSHSVYSPKTPSVSVSPSGGEVEEGSSVTLNCSSDANPAASYTWFRVNKGRSSRAMNQGQQPVFSPILTSDSGQYVCEAKNLLGKRTVSISLNFKYGPKNTYVFSSPSGEVEVDSSVTLCCSSHANPPANYTWFKEHGDSAGESGQNYTIANITSELGGNYYCQAHNAVGRHNSTILFIKVKASSSLSSSWTAAVAVGTIGVLLAAILLLVFLRMRNKRAIGQGGRTDIMEEPLPDPLYDNVSAPTNRLAPVAQSEPLEQLDDLNYASINTSRSGNQEVPGNSAGSPVQPDQIVYSLVSFPRPNQVPKHPDQRETSEPVAVQ